MTGPETMQGLIEDYRARRLTRRGLLMRAAALGVSASALSDLVVHDARAMPAAQDQPASGGTLREGYDLDFSRLDPVATSWYDPAFHALYDSLLIDAPDGTLQPNLAESWEIAADGMSVAFTLKEGGLFHTGRPVTAAAVKEVYEAIQNPADGSPLATLFSPVKTIEATDERTLVLTMAHPYYEVLNVVKTGYWAIANIETRKAIGDAYGQSVVDGTGPFLFQEWIPDSHTSVTRWNEYPGSIVPYFTNKGKAYLDGIRWEAILEGAQRAVKIENGEIDTLRNPLLQDVARLEQNSDLSVSSFSEPSGYILSTNFDRTDLDFHDLRMRQAISHAIDRQAIVTALLADLGSPLYGPITPADVYYDPSVEEFNSFDLEKAKSLVAELGWKAGDDGILTKNDVRHAFSLVVQADGNQFQMAVAENLPTIPLVVRNSVWVARPNVHGWQPHQYDI